MNPNELAHRQGAVELRLFEHGRLLTVELCESREEAEELARRWEDTDGVTVTIADLSHDDEPDEPFPVDEDLAY